MHCMEHLTEYTSLPAANVLTCAVLRQFWRVWRFSCLAIVLYMRHVFRPFMAVFMALCGLFWRGVLWSFCSMFAVPGIYSIQKKRNARYAVKIALYGLLWPCMYAYTFIGVLRFLWRFWWRVECTGIRHTVSILARFSGFPYSCRSR